MQIRYFALLVVSIALIYFQLGLNQRNNQFQQWKKQHGHSFILQVQQEYRQRIFYKNLRLIKQHNSNSIRRYEMGINQFTIYTSQEFVSIFLGLNIPKDIVISPVSENMQKIVPSNGDIDWQKLGAVTPVKNQGQCGACWAFSVTGALQALSKIQFGVLRSFSEQQLMDCSQSYGNYGCNGGWMVSSFQYFRDHGICSDIEYPYKAKVEKCLNCSIVMKISGYTEIKGGCTELLNALQIRPISVAVDATNWGSYKKGVLDKCSTNLNHASLLVGVQSGVWKVKDQWGTSWGQNGYIRLASGNTCGLCNLPSYANK